MYKISLVKVDRTGAKFNVGRYHECKNILEGGISPISVTYTKCECESRISMAGVDVMVDDRFKTLASRDDYPTESEYVRGYDKFKKNVMSVLIKGYELRVQLTDVLPIKIGIEKYLEAITDIALLIVDDLVIANENMRAEMDTIYNMETFSNPEIKLSTYEVSATVKAESIDDVDNMIPVTQFKITEVEGD